MDNNNALSKGAVQVVPEDRLEKLLSSGKKLRVKLGVDPTAPDLHLGHAVVLSKLREFQDLGHEIIFLIGDFTARIGDPSGKSKTRPPLSEKEVKANTKTYLEQVGRILDNKKVTVRYNSEWLSKMVATDFVELCGKVTVARLLERDDFSKRLKAGQPIGLHELLYPVFQGYDSVVLEADVELGGTDQTFNLMCGRDLQGQFEKAQQVVFTMPLLEGTDGKDKMSKSLGNAIGLSETADQAYGKLMSISDVLMWRYFELLLGKSKKDLDVMKAASEAGKQHPMALKKQMAYSIVSKFWSEDEAKQASEGFEKVFQKRDYSAASEVVLSLSAESPIWIVQLLKDLGAIKSSSEARRLIGDGAVLVDGDHVKEFKAEVTVKDGSEIRVGKHRVYKVKLQS